MQADAFAINVLLAGCGVAVTHTLLGPDHYLPFIMLARARRWSRPRTLLVTGLCGAAHVASSVVLGVLGLALGFAVGHLASAESQRGQVAAWLLVGFGVAYGLWGLRHALRHRAGFELHRHADDGIHIHAHGDHPHEHADMTFRRAGGSRRGIAHPGAHGAAGEHGHAHAHVHGHAHLFGGRHADALNRRETTFWTLFAVFVLGPCEPLIPLFMLPASRGRWELAAATAVLFGIVTIVCMLAVTALGYAGLARLRAAALERWSHAMAGAVIAASGLAVVFLGL